MKGFTIILYVQEVVTHFIYKGTIYIVSLLLGHIVPTEWLRPIRSKTHNILLTAFIGELNYY